MGKVLFTIVSFLLLISSANAQGPAPETAPPLFPKGALISYASDFFSRSNSNGPLTATSHPTFSHIGTFTFTWGFYRNFDLTAEIPVVTNRFESNDKEAGGTGIGDAMVLLKYRFLRKDSSRGTNQASFTIGPKFSTGKTSLADDSGNLLPAAMQPGSGSTDFFWSLNWTYTGLFQIRRLVADAEFHGLVRSEGTQETRLGNEYRFRFWLSYRPYESKDVSREWFIGPTLAWVSTGDQRIAGDLQKESSGNILMIGATTYVGIAAGVHLWLGLEWSVADSHDQNFSPIQRHISFGITRQFSFF